MSSFLKMSDIKQAIEKSIDENINKILDEIIEETKVKMEEQIRTSVGGIVSRVASYFSYREFENRIIIEVNFKNTKDNN